MTIFGMFILELMTMRYANFGGDHDHEQSRKGAGQTEQGLDPTSSNMPGGDHLGHASNHTDNADVSSDWQQDLQIVPEAFSAQLTSIFILEFGVIFHSIFVGLTLAVQGDGFNILYVVGDSGPYDGRLHF